MAHAIQLGALTDELITVITGLSERNDPRRFALCRNFSSRSLKSHNFGRTNQFEVKKKLDGLEEKFHVLNAEDLAYALRLRLDELSQRSNEWTPEILSLFLELSDRPLINSKVETLEFLKTAQSTTPLTWSDIVADDPLTEKGIWENVDFTAESSDDDYTESIRDASIVADDTEVSVGLDETDQTGIGAYLSAVDIQGLEELRKAQFWAHQVDADHERVDISLAANRMHDLCIVSELQVVREVLFMLSGLPTSLFLTDVSNGKITVVNKYALSHSSQSILHRLLDSFTLIGMKINQLRTWVEARQEPPLRQTFQAAVEDRLRYINRIFSAMQARFIIPAEEAVVTLIEQHDEVQRRVQPFLELARIVSKLESSSRKSIQNFQHLELLFESACLHQMVGDEQVFLFMAKLFFACLQTYLKPISTWMEEGEIHGQEDSFFVLATESSASIDPSSIWHNQFMLRTDNQGKVQAPKFLQAATSKIFTTGKSVVFLKQLGQHRNGFSPDAKPKLDFTTVCPSEGLSSLEPFSGLFDIAFENWIKGQYRSASLILRQRLFSECDLWGQLDALEYVYFLRDGAMFNNIAATIFEKIDRGKEAWNDRFLLTELVQGVFSSIDCVDSKKLAVRSEAGKYGDIHNRRRSVKIFNSISLEYTLPWPIANVVTKETIIIYQRIFTFLLQIRRATQIIERLRLLKDEYQSTTCWNEVVEGMKSYYSLRHRLLWFSNTIYTYLTASVLIPETARMRQRLSTAEDMDAMITVHEGYIRRLEDQCLLSRKLAPIHQAVISMLDLTILLSDAYTVYAGERVFDNFSRSISIQTKQRLPRSQHRPRWRNIKNKSDEADTSSSEESSAEEADTTYISFQEMTYTERIQKMLDQFEGLSSFVIAGLRGVARAGGEPCWETLAEKLEWGKRDNNPIDPI